MQNALKDFPPIFGVAPMVHHRRGVIETSPAAFMDIDLVWDAFYAEATAYVDKLRADADTVPGAMLELCDIFTPRVGLYAFSDASFLVDSPFDPDLLYCHFSRCIHATPGEHSYSLVENFVSTREYEVILVTDDLSAYRRSINSSSFMFVIHGIVPIFFKYYHPAGPLYREVPAPLP